MLGEVIPRNHKVPFDAVNKLMTKREISKLIDTVYRHCGQKDTVIFCDRIMALGFHHAFKAGISFGKDDMVVPSSKWKIVESTRAAAKEFEQQFNEGLITQGEKYNKVVDAWSKCTDKIADEMMREISAVKKDKETGREQPINSIYMMADSGARGSAAQMKQLAGMRGLMAKPSGEIIETPDHLQLQGGPDRSRVLQLDPRRPQGPRRHRAEDRQLRLSDPAAGRRCPGLDHHRGRTAARPPASRCAPLSMPARWWRRWRAASSAAPPPRIVRDPAGTEVIVKRGTLLGEVEVDKIVQAGIQEVRIRSVLTCEATTAFARPATAATSPAARPVNMGEAVGVIAAQSIGEPGTQLTMRTFHIGGAAQISEQSFIESNFEGTIRIKNRNVVRNSDGELICMTRNMAVIVVDQDGTERAVHRIPYGARLKVDEGDHIKRGQRMAEWDPYMRPILTEVEGTIGFEDLVEGQSMSESLDEVDRHRQARGDRLAHRRRPRSARLAAGHRDQGRDGRILKLARGGDARYLLAVDAILSVDPGGHVKAGDVIARMPTESAKTRDITGGLPRVAELFEARRPKEAAVIAEISGTVRFGRDYKNKRRLTIEPNVDGEEAREYLIPKGKHIHLQDGDVIEKGDYIVEGNPAPHDILAVKGVEELAAYLVNEIQEVYRLQGVAINDKHIEVIVRQMLQKVEIDDPGETELIQGEQLDRIELDEVNARAAGRGQEAGAWLSGPARHHQGIAADPLVHLGGLLPGDHPRAHRSRGQRQDRHARRTQGERHRRPADSGRHRRHDEPAARGRDKARSAHSRRARAGGRSSRRAAGAIARSGVERSACKARRIVERATLGRPFFMSFEPPYAPQSSATYSQLTRLSTNALR